MAMVEFLFSFLQCIYEWNMIVNYRPNCLPSFFHYKGWLQKTSPLKICFQITLYDKKLRNVIQGCHVFTGFEFSSFKLKPWPPFATACRFVDQTTDHIHCHHFICCRLCCVPMPKWQLDKIPFPVSPFSVCTCLLKW